MYQDSAQHGGREEAGMEGSTAVKMAKVLVLTEGLRSSQLDGGASQVALGIKNLPAMQETKEMWFQFLCGEESLEESMAIHSSILAWKIPWTEKPDGLQSIASQGIGHG